MFNERKLMLLTGNGMLMLQMKIMAILGFER